jgi:hypothetical protein
MMNEEYFKYLVELTDENYLINLIGNIFTQFKYDTKYISKLLIEKQEYIKFCNIIWENLFKEMTETINQYGAPVRMG